MNFIVLASDEQKEELLLKKTNKEIQLNFVKNFSELLQSVSANAYFILQENFNYEELTQAWDRPIFINSVINTLGDLKLNKNVCRINAWKGFLKNDKWEVATKNETVAKEMFESAGWDYVILRDEPGFISARIIAMIINEAYFALGDNVSTKEEINIAMKLGTNYPFGPFEWVEKIGLKNIYDLLKTLNKKSDRYILLPH